MRAALTLLVLLLLAPAAHAQQRTASTTDPAGDHFSGTDFSALTAAFDPSNGTVGVTVGFHAPFEPTGDLTVQFFPRSNQQCELGAQADGTLRIDLDGDSAHATYAPDDGTYLEAATFAFSDDRRSLSIGFGPAGALVGRDFACALAWGENYSEGDTVSVDFPGYERPECNDERDNDGDGKIDDLDFACANPFDDAEALGPTPALTRKRARQAVILSALSRGIDYSGLKVRCRKTARLVARCRARGSFRGTATVRRKRSDDEYADRVSRWRIRRR